MKTKHIAPNKRESIQRPSDLYVQLFEEHKQKKEKIETISQTLFEEKCSFVPKIGE